MMRLAARVWTEKTGSRSLAVGPFSLCLAAQNHQTRLGATGNLTGFIIYECRKGHIWKSVC